MRDRLNKNERGVKLVWEGVDSPRVDYTDIRTIGISRFFSGFEWRFQVVEIFDSAWNFRSNEVFFGGFSQILILQGSVHFLQISEVLTEEAFWNLRFIYQGLSFTYGAVSIEVSSRALKGYGYRHYIFQNIYITLFFCFTFVYLKTGMRDLKQGLIFTEELIKTKIHMISRNLETLIAQ